MCAPRPSLPRSARGPPLPGLAVRTARHTLCLSRQAQDGTDDRPTVSGPKTLTATEPVPF